jgi:hypothetical protein
MANTLTKTYHKVAPNAAEEVVHVDFIIVDLLRVRALHKLVDDVLTLCQLGYDECMANEQHTLRASNHSGRYDMAEMTSMRESIMASNLFLCIKCYGERPHKTRAQRMEYVPGNDPPLQSNHAPSEISHKMQRDYRWLTG